MSNHGRLIALTLAVVAAGPAASGWVRFGGGPDWSTKLDEIGVTLTADADRRVVGDGEVAGASPHLRVEGALHYDSHEGIDPELSRLEVAGLLQWSLSRTETAPQLPGFPGTGGEDRSGLTSYGSFELHATTRIEVDDEVDVGHAVLGARGIYDATDKGRWSLLPSAGASYELVLPITDDVREALEHGDLEGFQRFVVFGQWRVRMADAGLGGASLRPISLRLDYRFTTELDPADGIRVADAHEFDRFAVRITYAFDPGRTLVPDAVYVEFVSGRAVAHEPEAERFVAGLTYR